MLVAIEFAESKSPLKLKELQERDSKRDSGSELLNSVREMKADDRSRSSRERWQS